LIDAKVRAAVELMCELDPLAALRLKVSPDFTPECVFG
jgi:hypothetical protein